MPKRSERTNTKPILLLPMALLLLSCGGGGGGSSSSDRNTEGDNQPNLNNWDLTGSIVFEQAYDYGYHESLGIVSYNLATSSLLHITGGIQPRQNPSGNKTAFLQHCLHLPAEGDFYRAATIDEQSIITPITPCSIDIPNPTTGVFILDDPTEFTEVNISPDESLIAVTSNYDILSSGQSSVIGQAWNTVVYDLSGNITAELVDAYNAAWLPDGRLLYAYGENFYLTDPSLSNPTMIDDGGVLQGSVHGPAIHPDGTRFLFEYNAQIWRMNIDGSGIEKLIESDKPVYSPTWSPDGNMFVFTTWRNGFPASALKSFFFVDIVNDRATRIDLDDVLDASGEPWGPLSWVE